VLGELRESPKPVVERTRERVEISKPIPPPGGPHTHLLPNHLATGCAMLAGVDLTSAYLPRAIV